MSYNTKQKDLLLNVIRKHNHSFTIKEIFEEVKDSVGLTTVYRLVDKLVEEGIINKYIDKDNVTYYEYLEKCDSSNHFYLKCENCGEMIHVDCDCIEELSNHIVNEHGFELNHDHIIIKGLCKKCRRD